MNGIFRFNEWTLALAGVGLVSLQPVARADPPLTTDMPPAALAASTNAPSALPYGKKAQEGFFRRLTESGHPLPTPEK